MIYLGNECLAIYGISCYRSRRTSHINSHFAQPHTLREKVLHEDSHEASGTRRIGSNTTTATSTQDA